MSEETKKTKGALRSKTIVAAGLGLLGSLGSAATLLINNQEVIAQFLTQWLPEEWGGIAVLALGALVAIAHLVAGLAVLKGRNEAAESGTKVTIKDIFKAEE